MIPTSYIYVLDNGRLKSFPRYGQGGDTPIPSDNYALFYPEKVGSVNSNNMVAKIFLIKGENHDIKEFRSSKYGNNPKFLREAVENYIFTELSNPQQTLSLRRKKSGEIKSKRCKCK